MGSYHHLLFKKITYLLSIVCISIFVQSCQTSKPSTTNATTYNASVVDKKDPQLITVGKNSVSVGEFKYVYEKNNTNDSSAYSEQSIREYLELFTNFKLKVEEAKSRGMDTTKEFVNEFAEYKKQLAKPYLTENKVTDDLVREAYERLKEEIRASHILVKAEIDALPEDSLAAYTKIQATRQRIIAGEDFGKVASEISDDPSGKQNQGDLGYFTSLQMVYQFEDMAYKTPINQVSPIFRTRFGYHILKVMERRPSNGEVKIAHIFIRPDNDSLQAANKIMEISKRLQQGESWDKLCEQYSEDGRSKSNGGILDQWFSSGNLVKPLAEASFGLKEVGAISRPIRSPYGWHIIKLIERKELASFNEIENILKQRVSKDSRSELNRTFLVRRLRKENRFEENDKNKLYAFSKADSSLVKAVWNFNRADENNTKVLFSINKKAYRIKDFFSFIEREQQNRPNTSPAQYMESLYSQFVENSLLNYEEENLEVKFPEFRYLVNEYREGMLLFKIMEEKVWGKGVSDNQGLEKFFQANREKYQWDVRAKAAIYTSDRASVIDSLKTELKKDYIEDVRQQFDETLFLKKSNMLTSTQWNSLTKIIDFMRKDTSAVLEIKGYYTQGESNGLVQERIDLVKAYLTSVGIPAPKIAQKNLGLVAKKNGGLQYTIYSSTKTMLLYKFNQYNPLTLQYNEGTFQKGDNKALDLTNWEIGEYVVREANKSHLIIIKEIQAPRSKELNETKGAVISDYQQFLEKEMLIELRNKYKVSIDESEVKKLIKQ
ncbi:MAG: peptidylprolyl isomerase [Thermoflexibacter sp.]|jgi:peptidyl-prolyl cis-trans isomerase SurA|nr:peptidylprolyl isomerase [Thermoflexibacter sp.]